MPLKLLGHLGPSIPLCNTYAGSLPTSCLTRQAWKPLSLFVLEGCIHSLHLFNQGIRTSLIPQLARLRLTHINPSSLATQVKHGIMSLDDDS